MAGRLSNIRFMDEETSANHFAIEQGVIAGVDYVSSSNIRPKNKSPFAQNADFGAKKGVPSAVEGYTHIINTLGSGGILGLKYFDHSDGGKLLTFHDKYAYLISGASGIVAQSSQADWTGWTLTNMSATASAGDVVLDKGTDVTDTATLTADFDGTHSSTVAGSDKVTLDTTSGYVSDDPGSATLANSGFSNFSAAQCVDNDITTKGFDCPVTSSAGATITCNLGAGVTKGYRKFRASVLYNYTADADQIVFKIQYSDDGSSWSDASGNITCTYAGYSTKAYCESTWADAGAHRYWRIYLVTIPSYATVNFYEIEFYTYGTIYNASGVYTHGEQDISGVGIVKTATITFNKTTPAGTTLTVETRYTVDGTTWTTWTVRSSGDTVIPAGTVITTGGLFEWRANPATTDASATPSLDDVTVTVTAAYQPTGSAVSPIFDRTLAAVSSIMTWVQTTPTDTAIVMSVQGSTNGTLFGDWQTILASGDSTPLHRYFRIKITATTTDSAATSSVSSLLVSYFTDYSTAYKLDIGPLGRTSDQLTGNRVRTTALEDLLLAADGDRPFAFYIDDEHQDTGTVQSATGTTLVIEPAKDPKIALLLHFDGTDASTTVTDSSMYAHVITASGNAQLDTAQKVFGSASLLLDGTGDFLTVTDEGQLDIEYNEFTICCRGRHNALPGAGEYHTIASKYVDANNYWQFSVINIGGTYYLRFENYSAGVATIGISGTITPSTSTWYTYSVSRYGDEWNICMDGVVKATATDTDKVNNLEADLKIGARNSDNYFNGWIDELIITNDKALYASGYTVETAAYANVINNTDDIYNNRFVSITTGTGAGQVRWVEDYTGSSYEITIPSATPWATNPDGTSAYAFGTALKVRNLGVDPPEDPPTCTDTGISGNVSNRSYKLTRTNKDGFESDASPAAVTTVSSKKVKVVRTFTADENDEYWNIYGTASGGSVYKWIATIPIYNDTYYDNTADSGLGSLMLSNNQVPPDCNLIWHFNGYVFFGTDYSVWFSKAGSPDQSPNVSGDICQIPLPGRLSDIKSNPRALLFMGNSFIASNTSNTGFIFDSDIEVDTTTMTIISASGSLSPEASDICLDAQKRESVTFPTHFGLKNVVPGFQEQSLDSVPFSWDFQPYYERSINKDQMAGKYYGVKGYYLVSLQHVADGSATTEYLTFAIDQRGDNVAYGPWTFGMSCYEVIGSDLYGGGIENGIIYKLFNGNDFDGSAIEMIVDLPTVAPAGVNRTCEFAEFLIVVSADSDTTELTVSPKVDDEELDVDIGVLTSGFTGTERPGHNTIRSDKYPIGYEGSTCSMRLYNNNTKPLCIEQVVIEGEVLPLDD